MSIEQHTRARQIELARSLAARQKVYLDLCFWIITRDAALGARQDVASQKLLALLRRGVSEGAIVCPISASVFLELFKQPYTPKRRIATARLIDELSLGVTMIRPDMVRGTEIHRWLLKLRGVTDLYDMQELIWTKVSYTMGDTHPIHDGLDADLQLRIQRDFFDYMWSLPLERIVETIGNTPIDKDQFAAVSAETNIKNREYAHELRSYPGTYDIELQGAIEIAAETACRVLMQLMNKDAERSLNPTSAEKKQLENAARNILYHGIKKPEGRDALRSLHIGAAIHAGMRWDKERKFVPNDYYDFEHATAALAYCDAFFTETPLRVLVTRPQLALEKINDCVVISDVGSAIDHLEAIMAAQRVPLQA